MPLIDIILPIALLEADGARGNQHLAVVRRLGLVLPDVEESTSLGAALELQ